MSQPGLPGLHASWAALVVDMGRRWVYMRTIKTFGETATPNTSDRKNECKKHIIFIARPLELGPVLRPDLHPRSTSETTVCVLGLPSEVA
jgi:hypothetical protein